MLVVDVRRHVGNGNQSTIGTEGIRLGDMATTTETWRALSIMITLTEDY